MTLGRLSWLADSSPEAVADFNHNLCQVVEIFGMPGNRYTTDVTEQSMTFKFRDKKDYLLFFLMCPLAQAVTNISHMEES